MPLSQRAVDDANARLVALLNAQQWHAAYELITRSEVPLVAARGVGHFDATPLHAAAAAGQLALLHALLDRGADVNAEAKLGYTPLYMAVRNNRPAAVRLLLAAGADPDCLCAGHTALLAAVDRGLETVARLLLAGGASTFVANTLGEDPLHVAARHGSVRLCRLLLQAGADVNVVGPRGMTPAMVAREAGYRGLAKMLWQGAQGMQGGGGMEFGDGGAGGGGSTDVYGKAMAGAGSRQTPHMRYRPQLDGSEEGGSVGGRSAEGGVGGGGGGDGGDGGGDEEGGGEEGRIEMEMGELDGWRRRGREGGLRYNAESAGLSNSEQVAMFVTSQVLKGLGLSSGEKRRMAKRVERNARLLQMDVRQLSEERYAPESVARMLMTDSRGRCKNDEKLWNTAALIKDLRAAQRRDQGGEE